jgi:hypothetical protein
MELRLGKPREKWFFLLVLPLAVAVEWWFARTLDWAAYPRSEWVALVDLCLFLPVLYLAGFRSDLTAKARVLRALGIAGIGLVAARWIVPAANQFLIADLSSLRNATLVVVLAFEGWVLWKMIGAVYRRNADAKTLEREFGIPDWIARLLVIEARFWKAVWSRLGRK